MNKEVISPWNPNKSLFAFPDISSFCPNSLLFFKDSHLQRLSTMLWFCDSFFFNCSIILLTMPEILSRIMILSLTWCVLALFRRTSKWEKIWSSIYFLDTYPKSGSERKEKSIHSKTLLLKKLSMYRFW